MSALGILELNSSCLGQGGMLIATLDGGSILATVDVAAPLERVWVALTTDEVERWWGSDETYRVTQWAADLRLGGRWSLVVRSRDGHGYPAGGTFLKIDAPHKLVQTRKYEWDHPTLGRLDTIVTYRLSSIEGGTRVTVRHDGFAGRAAAAKEHAQGWERFLGWLEAYFMCPGHMTRDEEKGYKCGVRNSEYDEDSMIFEK